MTAVAMDLAPMTGKPVGFIGVGTMGRALANCLLKAGGAPSPP